MNAETKNLEILKDRVSQLNACESPRVGDFIKLPYGLFTRITHVWDDKLQTGGSANHHGYYLGTGYCSYSGGLDSGVKPSDIRPTNETKEGNIWFFSENYQKAHNGVHFNIPFRVYELIEGADESGLNEIRQYHHKVEQSKLPTLTRLNGNGQPYTTTLPKVFIRTKHVNEVLLKHLRENTGIDLKQTYSGIEGQPTEHHQIGLLLVTSNFKTKYYNNGTHENMLMLDFNND